ncbi:MAG: DNA (cytosine-5-)-methyltransferase [Oscillospiraceae bacterium]|nr:DNA (cytosine-5-)-methyltransferase [Oscillospiraceae bacterium]
MEETKKLRVVELFAGVGGFRVGFERCSPRFETVWANQWEPGQAGQWAYKCYCQRFGEQANCSNEDIASVIHQVPEHDLLVGGFPCQDYSVAHSGAKGIEGKKGVLWWSIDKIIKLRRPKYILLENVDRLLKSPAKQRGRDFGIILRCLNDEGYCVEWRVVNAADYGNAQRRRRIFIFATRRENYPFSFERGFGFLEDRFVDSARQWVMEKGFFADVFPVSAEGVERSSFSSLTGYRDLVDVTDNFSAPLYNAGLMVDGLVYSQELTPRRVPPITLGQILETGEVDENYYLRGEAYEKWEYLKGAKKIQRTTKEGFAYTFSEGAIAFPDPLDRPGRTMLTSEGSLNRSSHIVEDGTGNLRILTPVECERLNGFDDGWTDTGMPERQRYFIMGNALVVPLITRLGHGILRMERGLPE